MKWMLAGLLFLALESTSQNCKLLDDLSTYRGLRLGEKIPDSTAKHFSKKYSGGDWYLEQDSVKAENDYLFNFFKGMDRFPHFSHVELLTNKEGKLYSIEMWNMLSYDDSISVSQKKFPETFSLSHKYLVSVLGNQFKQIEDNDPPLGNALQQTWECEKDKIMLEWRDQDLVYGWNRIFLKISDPAFQL